MNKQKGERHTTERLGALRLRGGSLFVGALAAATAMIGGCGGDKNEYVPPPPPEVVVSTPIERDVTTYLHYTGVVAASESVDLRARVQGFLEEIRFTPGQRVKQGDVLFVIDKRQFESAVANAEAAVASRLAALDGAENDARLARELADQRAGPEIDALIKAARRDAMRADVEGARAQLIEARLNLEFCEVASPIDGRIGRNLVDVGNLVGRGEPTLLAQIVQATPAFVYVDLNETDVLALRRERERSGVAAEPGQVAPGQWRTCELSLADELAYDFHGRIDYVEPRLNPETGTLQIRARFENADEALVPGVFARLRFPIASKRSLLVPEAALLRDQQGRYALVVNAQSVVEARRVKIGAIDGDMRVVEEGLSPTDRIVTLGVLKARPGSQVAPKLQELAANSR